MAGIGGAHQTELGDPSVDIPDTRTPRPDGKVGSTTWGGYQYTDDPMLHNGATDATARYQQMGADAAGQAAPSINTYHSDQDRNMAYGDRANADAARLDQGNALGLMRDAANGNQPSRAELLGRQMTGDSINASMAMGASSRGGALGAASALQSAQQQGVVQRQQGEQSIAALRADEMAKARDAYMGGASSMRQQDYMGAANAGDLMGRDAQMSQAQADMQLKQNALNQQGQQYYEGLGFNVNNAVQNANVQREAMAQGQSQFQQNQNVAADQRGDAFMGTMINDSSGFYGNLSKSDLLSKQDVQPMGRNVPMGRLEPWMPPHTEPNYSLIMSDAKSKKEQRLMGQAEGMQAAMAANLAQPSSVQDTLDREAAKTAASEQLARDQKEKTPSYADAPGGIVRDNPYGDGSGGGDIVRRNPYGGGGDIIRDNPYGGGAHNAGQAMGDAGIDWSQVAAGVGKSVGSGMQGMGASGGGGGPVPQQIMASHDPYVMSDPASKRDAVEMGRGRREDRMGSAAASAQVAPPAQMMDAIGPGITYRYKPGTGEDPNKQQFGTTTQDLKSTPMGASMVRPRAMDGYDAIDTRQAVGPTLASLGNLNQRLRALESEKKRK